MKPKSTALLLVLTCVGVLAAETPPAIVLSGGTLLDLSNFGASSRDVHDAVVVIRGDTILYAGSPSGVVIPVDARIVDVRGGYVVPGFFDAFATVNNQAQANAYLYLGVTSIVGIHDPGGRRGSLLTTADPGPRVHRLERVVGQNMSDAQLLAEIERLEGSGAKVLLLYYSLSPKQVEIVARRARELGLATIGELGSTTYREAIDAGVMAFVHTSRYSLDLAPSEVRAAVAASPFGPPRTEFYEFLLKVPRDGPALLQHARMLASGSTALIPTLSLNYLDLPDHSNPWKEPAAALLDPADIHLPADRTTGRPSDATLRRDVMPPNTTPQLMMFEGVYRKAGAKYLAGSGTDAFGTMPGISLHTELELLVRIGLTPRQALAAATWNVGEVFGWPKVGRIAAGAYADLLVLDADPTKGIANAKTIRTVILAGRIIDRQALLAGRPRQP
ncbi:MAG: amidohydrolase family protein [Vicinamibacterales bacterium]